mmetsp:Transcript_3204/g.4309  ORF Transcript_3204/g.4309 Transcript_3204/m.4309 type:complete len:669 (-) Transcript_3204:60-2066(-)|eukprot:CAMPEP_0198152110 /NCGR_PEP_ID=MMETSP1443-20131203/58509_1 /TAXON_ID=186043 /ORGANISM="Entomoneis sp., Strain CCMP2396" /LENGTH=668 /DNA_ID=CAMNT_0043818023 /DNA_START=161 /DNA_END=2167 /DNA_ORIENTATION=-
MIGTSLICRRLLAKHLSHGASLARTSSAVHSLKCGRCFISIDAKSNVSLEQGEKRIGTNTVTTSGGNTAFFSAATERALTDVQKAHWKSYLATGRGAVSLFNSIDKDGDGKLNVADVHFFLVNAIQNENPEAVLPKTFKNLDERAGEQPIDLHEFQDWLVQSTQEHGYVSVQPAYERSKYVGERAPKKKPEEYMHHWNKSTLNQGLLRMQYAVRGDVVMRADELAAEGKPIIYTNIGNPHSVGQQPITYFRQVLALCDLPAECGVEHPIAAQMFPADVLERAIELRNIIGPSGTGSYTNSQGLAGFRQHIAEYIAERDGHPAYPGDIYLINGASAGIEMVLNGLIAQDNDAIMVPIPQYPIYSALITRLGGRKIGYELDEDIGWAVSREELEKRLQGAKSRGLTVKGLAMINPGNPTGQVYRREDVEKISLFCADNGICLLSDEVYQRNVYAPGKEFFSAKKIAMETPGCENLELVSFHSTSKGLIGECGRRGGYLELHGIDPFVQSQLYKLASSGLCPGVAGQIMTSLMVKGPSEGGESYEKFVAEEQGIFQGLARRAKKLVDGLNAIDGIECQPADGAMYAFPKITIPPKAIEVAQAKDQTPDTLYALSLLEETGICVVPASGFGQKKGRVGFRTTFLPPDDQLDKAVDMFARHHEMFCNKYSTLG